MVRRADPSADPGRPRRAGRPGFTLIELLVAIGIVALLAGLLVVGIRAAARSGRANTDRASIAALKTAVAQFQDEFKFAPPLVRDGEGAAGPVPLGSGPGLPVVNAPGAAAPQTKMALVIDPAADYPVGAAPFPATAAALPALRLDVVRFLLHRDASDQPLDPLADDRYSRYSLPYFVVGSLPAIADGVDGPGMRAPRRDGRFERAGKTYAPFFDVNKNARAIHTDNAEEFRVELRDAYGTPFRYYRWLRGSVTPQGRYDDRVQRAEDLNVPFVLLDQGLAPGGVIDVSALSGAQARRDLQKLAPPQAKDASYALVGAGPNRAFGDEPLSELTTRLGLSASTPESVVRARAIEDNVVEFGR